jgi:antitoxin component YwqK of YwqJK toxin-antitoxin module
MKKYLFLISLITIVIASCNNEKPVKTNPLIETKDGVETIWYPGKTQVKYRREYDKNKKRHGKWLLYNPQGKVMSSSSYDHGKKIGVWLVSYPNGQLRYTGEYRNDFEFGEWVFYNITGKKILEITYDDKGKIVKQERFENSNPKKSDKDSISDKKNSNVK